MKNTLPQNECAQVGKMQVESVSFKYVEAGTNYDYETRKSTVHPAHWVITAELKSKNNNRETMVLRVEHGVGQKLAEVLMPVIMEDASRKAQQLAEDAKSMIAQLGERAIKCIAEPEANVATDITVKS